MFRKGMGYLNVLSGFAMFPFFFNCKKSTRQFVPFPCFIIPQPIGYISKYICIVNKMHENTA